MPEQTVGAATSPTSLPHRRLRVREVSSRFMSPSFHPNPTSNTSDPSRPKSALRRRIDETLIPNLNLGSDKQPHKRTNPHAPESRANSDARVVSTRRPDTPIAVPSRYRQNTVTTAERLLREATSAASCPDSPPRAPDVDRWISTSDCARALNFSSFPKIPPGASVPRPLPSNARKEIRKSSSSHHEDRVHSLKVLANHHLQWRFANAKAEACLRSQKQDAERNLCALGHKISDIRGNVMKKRNEFAIFRGIRTSTTIVEAQMPYLDEWSTLEEDYSNSLLGATNALQSSLVRVPVGEEVRVDARELGEALNSALKVVELIGSDIQRFIEKAVDMEVSISELAKMVSEEKARIDECGCMLSKTYSLQVKECSLRGTLMQLHRCCKPATIINP